MNVEAGVMNKKYKRIKSKKVYSNPRFSVFEDDVLLPNGSRGIYYYRKSKPGVIILPFDGKKLYLVNQYRYVINKRLWELPMGRAENKNYLQQAKKELREETGLVAKKWKFLGEFFPTPGSGNDRGKVFLAQSLGLGQHQREVWESDMFIGSFSLKEVDKMITHGKIVDSWTIAAFCLFKLNFFKSA